MTPVHGGIRAVCRRLARSSTEKDAASVAANGLPLEGSERTMNNQLLLDHYRSGEGPDVDA